MDGISPCMSCRGIPCQCGNTLMTVKGMPKYEQLPPGIYETLYGEVVERYTELKRRVYWRATSRSHGFTEVFCEAGARKLKRLRATEGVWPYLVRRVTVGPAKKKEAG